MRLDSKIAIITGGGNGIGKTTALLFAKEGAKVVVTDINEENGINTVQDIRKNNGEAIFIKHNVSNEQDWVHVVESTLNAFGRIDILFNNAGIFYIKPLIENTLEEWNQLIDINVTGTFLGMKHVIPIMMKNGGGSIVNASSNAGLFGASGLTSYGTSKGAVRIMTKDAAMEYAEYNIRINSIHPGYIKTQMIEYAAQVANKTPEAQGDLVPLKRLGKPLDVAYMALFLSSDESSYVTGAEMVVDGGVSSGQSVWAKE